MAEAQTIDEVIDKLGHIIGDSYHKNNRMGYFPALYRKVTVAVQEGIANGTFEDGARMEKLDVIFANRYINAYEQYKNGEAPSRSWQVAFEASKSFWPTVLQHLLMGMNAHINLDLGIAAAQTAPGSDLADLKDDFLKINTVLASLVDDVKAELNTIWPHLEFWDKLAGRTDDVIINFSMAKARDHAWKIAEQLAPLPPTAQATAIGELDGWTATLGKFIWKPDPMMRLGNWIIRLDERGSPPKIIEILW